MQCCKFDAYPYLLNGDASKILLAKSDVPQDSFVEQYAALLNQCDVVPKPAGVKFSYLRSVNKDLASSGQIEPHQETGDSTLPRAAPSHHKCGFPSGKEKGRFM
jgi:hypothetical protein